MKDNSKIIPEKYVEFCRKVAQLSQEYNLNNSTVTFRVGYAEGGDWGGEKITGAWESGRHNEDCNQLTVSATIDVHTKVETTF